MCLNSKISIFKEAEEDMIIYKILQYNKGGFVTPFIHKRVSINRLITPDESLIIMGNWEELLIDRGAIHCYSTFEKANTVLTTFATQYPFDTHVIFKGIIPKGYHYVEGDQDDIAASGIICQKALYLGHMDMIMKMDSIDELINYCHENFRTN